VILHMLTASNGEKGEFLQYSEFQGQTPLSPLFPHDLLGYFGGGLEPFSLLCPFPSVPSGKLEAYCYPIV
jgi:hypothetical protein